MPSDSENESSSLKARLKAKLKEAGVVNSDSSDDEDKSKKKKLGLKSGTSAIPGTLPQNGQGGSRVKKNKKPIANGIDKPALSSDDEEDVITSKCRKPKPLESDESESDESTVLSARASSKKRSNVLSSSEDDGPGDSASSGSDASGDESEVDDVNSDESEDDDSDACSMIDNEAEEGEESDVSGEEEPHGETLSTEPSECSGSGSDYESDWISDTDEPCQTNTKSSGRHVATSNSAAASCGFASDSSDGTSEKCPICLLRFSNQEVGTPESCDHIFCAECLEQWSKNVNTCPVDRQEFTLILVRRRVGGKVVRQIAVERSEAKDSDEVEDPTYCEICGNCDHEDRMLLCDGCDLGYHMECLDPPLSHVPIDNWYCSECDHNASTNANGPMAEAVDVGIDEVRELLDDAQNLVGGAPLTRRAQRMLPRTQQMERVLRRIRTTFLQRQEALQSQPSTSSGIESQSGEPKKKKRRIVKRKSTTKKKRKATTKRKTKQTSKKKSAATKRTTKKKTTGKKRKARKPIGSKSKRMKVCSDG